MNNNRITLGKVSLWTFIAGAIVPGLLILLLIVGSTNTPVGPDGGGAIGIGLLAAFIFLLSGFLCVTLELVAFGCGISAIRTKTGKAGLAVSCVLLSLVALGFLCLLFG